MGNLGGAEVLVILLVALIVLGPTKLPPAIRQVGRMVGEVRRIGQGFQQELREAAQPLQETKEALKAADKELREAAQEPIEEMKDTLKAADKELREAAGKPVDETKAAMPEDAGEEFRDGSGEPVNETKELKAAGEEFRDGSGEPVNETKELKAADKEELRGAEPSQDEADSGPDNAVAESETESGTTADGPDSGTGTAA